MKRKQLIALGAIIAVIFTACSNPFFPEKEDRSDEDTGNPTIGEIIEEIDDNMIYVAAGTFQMGLDGGGSIVFNQTPVHTVTLSRFYISKYPVTQAQYEAVIGINPSYFTTANGRAPEAGETDVKRPVEDVSWYDALEFCNKLSDLEGKTPVYTITDRTPATGYPITSATVTANWSNNGYRLPTEAEWEYAAKGGPLASNPYKIYSGSDTVGDVAWYNDNSGNKTHEVGKKLPNELGLYDMSGNVEEWCWDWYGSYSSEAQSNPVGASSGLSRMTRGGGWQGGFAGMVRSAMRYGGYTPFDINHNTGFRLVRTAQ